MGRLLFFICVIAASGYTLTRISISQEPLAVVPVQEVSVIQAVEAVYTDFNETGALIFYPNNVGPVPYFFYQNSNGSTVAKALVFPHSTPADFSSWTGAQISVAGHLVAEHVIVNHISYLSGP